MMIGYAMMRILLSQSEMFKNRVGFLYNLEHPETSLELRGLGIFLKMV